MAQELMVYPARYGTVSTRVSGRIRSS